MSCSVETRELTVSCLQMSESVRSARARLGSYPLHLSVCATEAAGYGRCVGEHLGEVRKDQCLQEWRVFLQCVRNSAKKQGGRM